MTRAAIHLGDGVFGNSAKGLGFGEISLHVGELTFPDSSWTDFVVVVLTWWCSALFRLLAGEPKPIEVRFMEGPYLVMLGPLNGDVVHLVLVEDRWKREIRGETDVDTRILIRSVLSAADIALMECKSRSWWSDDADKLLAARDELRQEFRDGKSE
jgi:hypothetical protein